MSDRRDNAAAWALADRIMDISYKYAVAMHESIVAGKGAQGWNEVKHAAEIVTAIGDAFDGARDAAAVAYRRGIEAGKTLPLGHEFEPCPSLLPQLPRFCILSSPAKDECHFWHLHPAGYCGRKESEHG